MTLDIMINGLTNQNNLKGTILYMKDIKIAYMLNKKSFVLIFKYYFKSNAYIVIHLLFLSLICWNFVYRFSLVCY